MEEESGKDLITRGAILNILTPVKPLGTPVKRVRSPA
jgi:hypothetical protein